MSSHTAPPIRTSLSGYTVDVTTTKKARILAAFTPSSASAIVPACPPGVVDASVRQLHVPKQIGLRRIMCKHCRISVPFVIGKDACRGPGSRASTPRFLILQRFAPQIATTGTSHSSIAARHCSTERRPALRWRLPITAFDPPQRARTAAQRVQREHDRIFGSPRSFCVARCWRNRNQPEGIPHCFARKRCARVPYTGRGAHGFARRNLTAQYSCARLA